MDARKTLDERPGSMPDIRVEGSSITYHLAISGIGKGTRLVVRCDPDGAVWAAIEHCDRHGHSG